MNTYIFSLLLCMSCSSKKKEEPKAAVSTTSAQEDSDCPPGVKTACNVPTMTQEEIDAVQAKNKDCVQECVQSRQMEAIDHNMIEYQCLQSCNQEHFVGQVQVAPSLPQESAEPKKEE